MKKLVITLLFTIPLLSGYLFSQDNIKKEIITVISDRELEETVSSNIKNHLAKYENLYTEYQCKVLKNELNLDHDEIIKLIKTNQYVFDVYFKNQTIFFYLKVGARNKTFQEIEDLLIEKKCYIEKASVLTCKIQQL